VNLRSAAVWLRWLAIYALATAVFLWTMGEPLEAEGLIVYLLIIVGAAAAAGPWLAALMVLGGYIAVDWIFIPPVRALGGDPGREGMVLAAFVASGTVVSALVVGYRGMAERATARARDVERLGEERRRLEGEIGRAETLREAERLKNALLASVSHDLRTPLATISMLADNPQRGANGDAQILEECRRLAGFLAALDSFATAEGELAMHSAPQVAEDLVGAAARSAAGALAGHPLRISQPADAGILVGHFDFTLALRILVNLLENAARYAPADTPIDLTIGREGRRLAIAVLDRGPGLQPVERDAVFTPFKRGTAARRHAAGAGLGLAIARTFARAQGGDVYRDREGGGSAFVLLLPMDGGGTPGTSPG
jgi:two-component system sensor histidine kinase KdpD